VELPFALWRIAGLDNYSIPRPLYHHAANAGASRNATTGSGPSASFLGSDMRAALLWRIAHGQRPIAGIAGVLRYRLGRPEHVLLEH